MKTIVLLLLGAGIAAAQADLPEGEGKALVKKICTGCHGLENITGQHMGKDEWSDTVNEMITDGAQGSDEEMDKIVEYLAKNFGPRKVNVNSASAAAIAGALAIPQDQAAAIVAYREKNGKFKQWQDLKNVGGLDMKKIEQDKDRLVF
jgi:competence protein ComEA